MKQLTRTRMRRALLVPVLVAGLGSLPAPRVAAQTFKVLHTFTKPSGPNSLWPNADGAAPNPGVLLLGNTLFGTAVLGGSSAAGDVFKLKTDGTGFANLYNFSTGGEASVPSGGIVFSGTAFYGTTAFDGSSDNGTVFSIKPDGTGFATLYEFTGGADGDDPAGLLLSGSTLYGATYYGGTYGFGTVFAINTDGTGFTDLYSFSPYSGGPCPCVNGDGAWPGWLVLVGNTLYGTTSQGGNFGRGTLFAVNTDGTSFTTLYHFTGGVDGGYPGGIVVSSNRLYGKQSWSGQGTVFAINTDGTGFTNLYAFTAPSTNSLGVYTNADGMSPSSRLLLVNDTLYGGTSSGGAFGNGTVFALSTDGTTFTTLHSFSATIRNDPNFGMFNSDGGRGAVGLISFGNTLFGTVANGGYGSVGTVFSVSLPVPRLTITPAGSNVVLSWPTNFAGFDYTGYTLQSTTNLGPTAVWNTNFPPPVIVNGLNTVTNPITGLQQFYRLAQ